MPVLIVKHNLRGYHSRTKMMFRLPQSDQFLDIEMHNQTHFCLKVAFSSDRHVVPDGGLNVFRHLFSASSDGRLVRKIVVSSLKKDLQIFLSIGLDSQPLMAMLHFFMCFFFRMSLTRFF